MSTRIFPSSWASSTLTKPNFKNLSTECHSSHTSIARPRRGKQGLLDDLATINNRTERKVDTTPPRKIPKIDDSTQAVLPDTLITKYIRDTKTLEEELQKIQKKGKDEYETFALDIEWRVTYTKNAKQNKTAVLQIANDETALVIHLHVMKGSAIYMKAIP